VECTRNRGVAVWSRLTRAVLAAFAEMAEPVMLFGKSPAAVILPGVLVLVRRKQLFPQGLIDLNGGVVGYAALVEWSQVIGARLPRIRTQPLRYQGQDFGDNRIEAGYRNLGVGKRIPDDDTVDCGGVVRVEDRATGDGAAKRIDIRSGSRCHEAIFRRDEAGKSPWRYAAIGTVSGKVSLISFWRNCSKLRAERRSGLR
jgi:hypothetical protein